MVMLPFVLALCVWWMRGRIRWRDTLALAPFALISVVASAWTIWEQRFHARAIGPDWAQTVPERLIIAGKAIWFYLGKLVWPHPLIFIYPRWDVDSSKVGAYLPLLAAIAGLVALWFIHAKWGRALFFAAAYYIVSLFPVLGFFSVFFFRYSFVSDHFQYLASMGPLALAGAGTPARGFGLLSTCAARFSSAPATTRAATVEMLMLFDRSPPVPHVSISMSRSVPVCASMSAPRVFTFTTFWRMTCAIMPSISNPTAASIEPRSRAFNGDGIVRRLKIPDYVKAPAGIPIRARNLEQQFLVVRSEKNGGAGLAHAVGDERVILAQKAADHENTVQRAQVRDLHPQQERRERRPLAFHAVRDLPGDPHRLLGGLTHSMITSQKGRIDTSRAVNPEGTNCSAQTTAPFPPSRRKAPAITAFRQ